MNFFKKPYTLRRYSEPVFTKGYSSIPYADQTLQMDVQTLSDDNVTTADGTVSVQRLKAFSDSPILAEDAEEKQKADRIWFQGKWFECKSSRLSGNTPLKHYTATFIECLDKEDEPKTTAIEKKEGVGV